MKVADAIEKLNEMGLLMSCLNWISSWLDFECENWARTMNHAIVGYAESLS